MTIGEGLQVESEQFARIVPSRELRQGLDAWIQRQPAAFESPAQGTVHSLDREQA